MYFDNSYQHHSVTVRDIGIGVVESEFQARRPALSPCSILQTFRLTIDIHLFVADMVKTFMYRRTLLLVDIANRIACRGTRGNGSQGHGNFKRRKPRLNVERQETAFHDSPMCRRYVVRFRGTPSEHSHGYCSERMSLSGATLGA